MAHQKPVTNEELLEIMQDLMQMTGEGFVRIESRLGGVEGRLDGVEGRLGGVEGRLDGVDGRLGSVEGELKELKNASYRHEVELGKQTRLIESAREGISNIHVDLNAILHRIATLERKEKLSNKERVEAQTKLQQVVNWAQFAAEQIGVPLKLA